MMIHLEGINKTYFNGAPLHVLKGIDLDIEKGEMVSIMGASGSGKSTLLNILGILDTYDTGTYTLNGQLIRNLSETRAAELRNRMIGFIFQSFNLISFKNAMENVALPLYYQGISRKKRNAMALEYLDMVGLKDWAEHMPNEMSGGQKQRAAVARALITNPELVLADEPTGALDSRSSDDLLQMFGRINQSGQTILMVTHDMGSIIKYCDKVVLLNKGEFIAQGSAGKMVDLYKKILAGQMDALRAELEVMNDFSGDKVVKAEKSGDGSAENGASGNEAGNNDAGDENGSGAVDGTAENGVGSASDGTGNPAGLNGEMAKKPGLFLI